MRGEVVQLFPSRAEVELAWAEYQARALEMIADPRRLADRDFMEGYVRAEAHWKRLFNALDRRA